MPARGGSSSGRKRDAKSRQRRLKALAFASGLGAIGFCAGLVAGSLLETPRLLASWLRGPVDTVSIGAAPEPTVLPEPPLEGLAELQRRPAPRSEPPAPATPREENGQAVPRARSATPPEGSVDPSLAPRTRSGRSVEDIIAEIEAGIRSRPQPRARPQPLAPVRQAAVPAPAPESQTPAPGPVVQVGSYLDRGEADAAVARLRGRGFEAFISGSVATGGERRHRVRVRPPQGERAPQLAQRLRALGYPVWVTRE